MKTIFEYLINRKLTAKDANKRRTLKNKLLCICQPPNHNKTSIVEYDEIPLAQYVHADEIYDIISDSTKDKDRSKMLQLIEDIANKRGAHVGTGISIRYTNNIGFTTFGKVSLLLDEDSAKYFNRLKLYNLLNNYITGNNVILSYNYIAFTSVDNNKYYIMKIKE